MQLDRNYEQTNVEQQTVHMWYSHLYSLTAECHNDEVHI